MQYYHSNGRGFIIAFMLLTMGSACTGTYSSGEPTTMTCPPGMTSAVNQNICIRGTCGNGVIDPEEECDDGNQIAGDGCSPDCRSAELCGNAIVDHAVGEVCDDGNTDPDDQCCSDCRSCPDRAVMPLAGTPAPIIEHTRSAALPCRAAKPMQATQPPRSPAWRRPSPVGIGSLLTDLLLPQAEPPESTTPAPLQFMSLPAPFSLEPPLFQADISGSDPSAWIRHEVAHMRATAEELQQRLRSRARAHKQLQQAEALLSEELQHARDMIAQLEQINAELHQYVASECQLLPHGRTDGL